MLMSSKPIQFTVLSKKVGKVSRNIMKLCVRELYQFSFLNLTINMFKIQVGSKVNAVSQVKSLVTTFSIISLLSLA